MRGRGAHERAASETKAKAVARQLTGRNGIRFVLGGGGKCAHLRRDMTEAESGARASAASAQVLLSVQGLVTSFSTDRGDVRAVDGVSFDIPMGSTVGLVGESGCGKSVTALSVMRLVPSPPGRIERGKVLLRDRDLLALSEREMRDVRGNEISMIFQEPMTSLNPVYTVGSQIVEAVRLHQDKSRREARHVAVDMLRRVGLASPETNVDAYPHQLSGGMRQRVMIAMALACQPALLIADEPTTALDVTIQAQILELLGRLKESLEMSVLLITHDLGVVAETARHVLVMYAGQVVESAPVKSLFARPAHPYTRGLLRSLPSFATDRAPGESPTPGTKRPRLPVIEGLVPDLAHLPKGCRFQERCSLVEPECRAAEPALEAVGDDAAHLARCIRRGELS